MMVAFRHDVKPCKCPLKVQRRTLFVQALKQAAAQVPDARSDKQVQWLEANLHAAEAQVHQLQQVLTGSHCILYSCTVRQQSSL